MKQNHSLIIYCFICCISLVASSFAINTTNLHSIRAAQQREKEQKIRDILGPDADLARFTTPLQAQLEKIRREKEKKKEKAEQPTTITVLPSQETQPAIETPAHPSQEPSETPAQTVEPQPAEQIAAPQPLAPAPPKPKPRPQAKPKPKPADPQAVATEKPQKLEQKPAQKPNISTPAQSIKPPKPQQATTIFDLEMQEKEERKLSLKLFSMLIPVLASYNEERLFGKVLEKDNLANQKHAAKTIATFIQKLTEKLQKIDDKKLYDYLKSNSFKAQSWSLELFTRLNAVCAFCKKQLKHYQGIAEQPDGIKELKKQFEEKIMLLNQLSRQYFNYNPTKK